MRGDEGRSGGLCAWWSSFRIIAASGPRLFLALRHSSRSRETTLELDGECVVRQVFATSFISIS
jgi:hypothetical protein